MTAAEVKDALRRRHPAIADFGAPGAWTCIEEWMNIDLLAFAAWSKPPPARCRHARIGYEVKVSRADYKRDLKNPYKRARAVAFCHEFYMAVPHGLLHPDELAFKEPFPMGPEPFGRERCPGAYGSYCTDGRVALGVHPYPRDHQRYNRGLGRDYSRRYDAECPTCRGVGWLAESPAVRAGAPRLWVPSDVGLVEVGPRGCVVIRQAPLNPDPSPLLDQHLGHFVRWVSVRPDPRHQRD